MAVVLSVVSVLAELAEVVVVENVVDMAVEVM